ncbi:MAG: T9SS type A sorting domain-containing protein [Salibacteraceae bacterium]|nr:T9SS type A sorting domain-containing protein [Salibacteraceae bacterium]
MKKVISISLLSIALNAFGQRISGPTYNTITERALPALPEGAFFFEGFENANLGDLPSDWSSTSNSNTAFYTGISGAESGQANENGFWPVPKHTVFAMTNDDVCNCDKSSDYLTSKTFDLRGLSDVSIGFEAFQNGAGGQVAELQITKNGTDWETLVEVALSNNWKAQEINLTQGFYTSRFQFRFFYSDNGVYASGLALDNIYLRSKTVKRVTKINTYNVSGSDPQSIVLYDGIPLRQARKANLQFGVEVQNETNDTLDLKLLSIVNTSFKDTSSIYRFFPNDAKTILSNYPNRFSAFEKQTYNCFSQAAEASTDSSVVPLSVTSFSVTDSLYYRTSAFNDGTGIWIQNAPDQVGTYFHLFSEDTLRAVRINIHQGSSANSRVKLNVYDANDLSAPIYESEALLIPLSAVGSTFSIPVDTIFSAGKYVFSIQKVIGTVVIDSRGDKTAAFGEVIYKTGNQAWKNFPYYPTLALVFDAVDPNCSGAIEASIDPISCFGLNDGTIRINEDRFTANATFTWSNGSVFSEIANLSPGTYSITVTDSNSCVYTDEITLNETDSLSLAINTIADSCSKNVGEIDLVISGGTAPYSIIWNGTEISNHTKSLSSGSYSINISDVNGCNTTTIISVTGSDSLSSTFNLTKPSCGNADGMINIQTNGSAPFSYHWSTNETTNTISAKAAGIYTVTISDAIGCAEEHVLFLNDSLAALISSASLVNETCAGLENGSIFIDLTGGTFPLIFSWSDSSVNEDLINVGSGTYHLSITDNNGCKSFFQESVGLDFEPIQIDAAENGIFCLGNKGKITALAFGGLAPYNYLWSNGDTTNTIDSLTAGIYNLTVSDQNECESNLSTAIFSIQTLSPSIDSIFINSDSIGFISASIYTQVDGGTPAYTYLWSNGAKTQNLVNIDTGTYVLTVTDRFGCVSTFSKYISDDLTVIESPSINAELISIFPNPTNGNQIEITSSNKISGISVYDISGKLIKHIAVKSTQRTNLSLEEDLSDGVYFLKVSQPNGNIQIQKLIRSR